MAVAEEAGAPGCTPSRSSNTTARSGRATFSRARRTPGKQWERQGRSGKLVFSESITEYRDQQGELVVTARSVGVMTEGPVAREGR